MCIDYNMYMVRFDTYDSRIEWKVERFDYENIILLFPLFCVEIIEVM